jgi:hypothetical protein
MTYLQIFGAAPRSQADWVCRSWSERSPPRSPGAATAAAEAMESTNAVAKVIFLIIEVLRLNSPSLIYLGTESGIKTGSRCHLFVNGIRSVSHSKIEKNLAFSVFNSCPF